MAARQAGGLACCLRQTLQHRSEEPARYEEDREERCLRYSCSQFPPKRSCLLPTLFVLFHCCHGNRKDATHHAHSSSFRFSPTHPSAYPPAYMVPYSIIHQTIYHYNHLPFHCSAVQVERNPGGIHRASHEKSQLGDLLAKARQGKASEASKQLAASNADRATGR